MRKQVARKKKSRRFIYRTLIPRQAAKLAKGVKMGGGGRKGETTSLLLRGGDGPTEKEDMGLGLVEVVVNPPMGHDDLGWRGKVEAWREKRGTGNIHQGRATHPQ
jgi:hypothetical protein